MNVINLLLIPAIPLPVFLVLGIFSHKIKPSISGVVGVAGLVTSTLLSYYTAWQYFFVQGKLNGSYQTFVEKITWMRFTETLHIDMGVLIDPISVMMLIVVSTASTEPH